MKRFASTHWVWSIGGQILTRGLAGVKFFFLAKILGPEGLGAIAAFLLLIAIFEALSDSGILSAVVHSANSMDESQKFMVLIANLSRGIFLLVLAILSRDFVFDYFKGALSLNIINLLGAIFVIKAFINPAYYLMHRHRQFRTIFLIDGSYVFLDFVLSIFLLFQTKDILYVIFSLMISEFFKCVFSWVILDHRLKLCWNLSGVKSLYSYGRWVWAGSFFTFGLNQLDKILVAKYFGLELFGIYQFSSKLTQMAIADLFTTLTSYIFPVLAAANRVGISDLKSKLKKWVKIYLIGLVFISCAFQLMISSFIDIFFGGKWSESLDLIRVFNFPMFVGGLIALSVVALRAIGQPKKVFYSTLLQIFALLLIVVPAAKIFGLIGVVLSLGMAGLVSYVYISYQLNAYLKCNLQS